MHYLFFPYLRLSSRQAFFSLYLRKILPKNPILSKIRSKKLPSLRNTRVRKIYSYSKKVAEGFVACCLTCLLFEIGILFIFLAASIVGAPLILDLFEIMDIFEIQIRLAIAHTMNFSQYFSLLGILIPKILPIHDHPHVAIQSYNLCSFFDTTKQRSSSFASFSHRFWGVCTD